MKNMWLCMLLIFVGHCVWAQEQNAEMRRELQELKEAVRILRERDQKSQQEIQALRQDSQQLREELESLKQGVTSDINLEDDLGLSMETPSPEQRSELLIEEEFGEEEEEETQFYLQEATSLPGMGQTGFIEEESNKLTSGALVISGFFVLEYQDWQTAESSLEPLFPDDGTFNNSRINLYIDSRFFDNFRFFTELRFNYNPNTVFLELTQGNRSGEVVIERAWAEWEFREWLNFRAGNFLTPYGIWNVEHGAPILLSSFIPFLLQRQIFPERVTGLQIHGNVVLGDFDLGYNAWVGNGKGSEFANQDDQQNKSIGGRLQLKFPDFNLLRALTIGVSGYMGKVQGPEFPGVVAPEDIAEIFAAEGNWEDIQEITLAGYSVAAEAQDEYEDQVIGLDLSFRLQNFYFQGEFIYNFVRPTGDVDLDINGDGFTDLVVKPHQFAEFGMYVQFAYEFDFSSWGAGWWTPFLRYEFIDANNEIRRELATFTDVAVGINWKVNPSVVVKAEFHDVRVAEAHERDLTFFISSINVSY